MDARLQDLIDHHEIRKTMAEYCHGCDRADVARMGGVYTEDSWDDHGDIKAPGREFAEIMTRRILDQCEGLFHMLGQSQIRVDGDEAAVETYFIAVTTARVDGVEQSNQLGGRYVDRLVRDGERWRIKHRVTVRDWTTTMPVAVDWLASNPLTRGQRSNADPSFAALGLIHSGEPVRRAEADSAP